MKPKLKNFFASEPSCKALGSAKKCAIGKPPSFSKKAKTTFEKLGGYPFKVLKISKLPKSITKIRTPFSRVSEDLVRKKNTLTATQWEISQATDPGKLARLQAIERKMLRERKILKSTILN